MQTYLRKLQKNTIIKLIMNKHQNTPIFNLQFLYLNMKKKIYLTLAFLFMLVYTSYSYNPKIIDTLKIHQQIKKFGLDEKILNFKANFFESIVFKIKMLQVFEGFKVDFPK